MSSNIGSQNANIINNVNGDQRIHGHQYGQVVGLDSARQAVRDLRRALDEADLDLTISRAVTKNLDDLDSGLGSENPAHSTVRHALDRATGSIDLGRRVATTGQSLAGPIQAFASWVGS